VTYLVRPATDAERDAAAASWRTMLKLPKEQDEAAGQLLVGIGHYSLGRAFLQAAIHEAIDAAMLGTDQREPCTVLVADHPDAPGLPLGWVAFDEELRQLLALHVQANARKAWVGRTLLRHVLDLLGHDTPSALMTGAGRRLLGHVRASMGEAVAA